MSSINRHIGANQVTNGATETFDVTFSAAVSGVAASNFSVSGTDGTGTVGTVPQPTGRPTSMP